jgi:cell division protease FtsH
VDRKHQINLWYLIAAIFAVIWLRDIWVTSREVEPVPYSRFLELLEQGKIVDIAIRDKIIQASLKEPLPNGEKKIVATRVEPDLAEQLKRYNVQFRGVVDNTFLRDLLSWIVPALVFVGVWMFFIRRMTERQGLGGGFMALGKSKAKVYVETDTKVTFTDVAGVDEAKSELEEVVGFLKDPKRYSRLGGRAPKGVLLIGPPGTGKTLLARAVAGEAGVPFLSINGSEFVEMFVGLGAARVRDLFEQARSKAPAIIFIDELDALGRARGAYAGGGHDEKEQTLNQLLVEMDGFDPATGLVLLAATNRPEILDPALLRAGRFDRQVLVDRPDKVGRLQILKVHAKKVQLAPAVDLEQVAALTPGFSGADLANLVNEAAVLATRRDAPAVTLDDFTGAIERMIAGLEKKNRLLNTREREIVAYHEMGHAILAMGVHGVDPVHKVSIIPRGVGALGYTIQRPTEERFLMTREELEGKMQVLLGGRAAEHIIFKHLSTGAADDLAKVTDIARSMVTRYGMAPELGPVSLEDSRPTFLGGVPQAPWQEREYSEQTAREVDCAVRKIVEQAFERAVSLLERNRMQLENGARLLLEKETLTETDLQQFVPSRA